MSEIGSGVSAGAAVAEVAVVVVEGVTPGEEIRTRKDAEAFVDVALPDHLIVDVILQTMDHFEDNHLIDMYPEVVEVRDETTDEMIDEDQLRILALFHLRAQILDLGLHHAGGDDLLLGLALPLRAAGQDHPIDVTAAVEEEAGAEVPLGQHAEGLHLLQTPHAPALQDQASEDAHHLCLEARPSAELAEIQARHLDQGPLSNPEGDFLSVGNEQEQRRHQIVIWT